MCSFAAARDTIGTQEILKFAPKTEGREMPHYVVEIQPDGRPALRLVLEDEPGWLPIPEEVVVDPVIIELDPVPEQEEQTDRGVVIIQM
tara:strand:+ start:662 stop:928 length:267 start_codon:yes stop_codon:yes gene_type:complete